MAACRCHGHVLDLDGHKLPAGREYRTACNDIMRRHYAAMACIIVSGQCIVLDAQLITNQLTTASTSHQAFAR